MSASKSGALRNIGVVAAPVMSDGTYAHATAAHLYRVIGDTYALRAAIPAVATAALRWFRLVRSSASRLARSSQIVRAGPLSASAAFPRSQWSKRVRRAGPSSPLEARRSTPIDVRR